MENFDVLIVGNGILGLSTAYALLLEEPNIKLAIIGPFDRKGAASAAAGAMLNCFSEINKYTLKGKYTSNKFQIARSAAHLWPNWIKKINEPLDISDRVAILPGTFILLNPKSGKREDENFLAICEAVNKFKEPFEFIQSSEIPGLNPVEDCRPLKSIYLPKEGSINSLKLLRALEKNISFRSNVQFFDEMVIELLINKGKIKGVKTECGKIINSNVVLLTAGSGIQNLLEKHLELLHRVPKLLAAPGCSLILKMTDHKLKNVVRTPNRSGSCGLHMLPTGINEETLYLGSTNSVSTTLGFQPKAGNINTLLDGAMEQFNQNLYKAEIIEWRVGNRPVTCDTFPLIGACSISGLWFLTGTYRDGLHSSPLLATSMARELLGRLPLFQHHFKAERLPIEFMPKEQAIEEFTEQYYVTGYEHGLKLPKIGWDLLLKSLLKTRVESIYEALEVDIGLSPDILFMFVNNKNLIPLFRQYYKDVKQEFSDC